ncbi:MAG: hypothetical protein R3338_12815, partial [Thermoanaerobaculia bacterium]|nr:hypothetical protein [Thermoanaerobaculia bacterium]
MWRHRDHQERATLRFDVEAHGGRRLFNRVDRSWGRLERLESNESRSVGGYFPDQRFDEIPASADPFEPFGEKISRSHLYFVHPHGLDLTPVALERFQS